MYRSCPHQTRIPYIAMSLSIWERCLNIVSLRFMQNWKTSKSIPTCGRYDNFFRMKKLWTVLTKLVHLLYLGLSFQIDYTQACAFIYHKMFFQSRVLITVSFNHLLSILVQTRVYSRMLAKEFLNLKEGYGGHFWGCPHRDVVSESCDDKAEQKGG